MRKEACQGIRDLKAKGYSNAQISSILIVPEVGKGKKAKKNLRDGLVKKLAALKKKKAGDGEEAQLEEAS